MSFYPIPTKKYGQESKLTRPNPKIDKTLKKVLPKNTNLIHCPRFCQQHRTPTGNLNNGRKSYDPIKKHCHLCGLQK
jgi:hypothetical protein